MKRILSVVLILALVLSLAPAALPVSVSAKETLTQTWSQGTHYGTVNPNIASRKYIVLPCQEGDIVQLNFPTENWAIYVHFADAEGDFGLEYIYRKGRPECVVINEINGRIPTELRLTTFYWPNTSATITDELWATFDVSITKSTMLPGDLLASAQWKQGSYENPAATIRKQCQIPCSVGDTFRFDFTGDFWDLYILPGDENGAITLTNTYLSSDKTYTVKQVDGKDPTNLILVAVPGQSFDINAQIWQSFSVCCVKENNMFTVASQNYGLWFNGTTQGVEAANVETAAAGWREMVLDNDVDILCGQEWIPHFDRDKTIDANDKVFGKIFEYQFAKNTTTYDGKHIASRTPLTDIAYITHSNGTGRTYTKAYTVINGKKVCIVSAHLSFEEDININRKEEIVELLAAIQSEKYVVLTGDFNVFTPDEFKIFEDAGYSLANAGAFGEFNTWPNFGYHPESEANRCLDNIIVSPSIAIRDAYVDYRRLSDHAMVVAKLEFLEDGAYEDSRLLCPHCDQLVNWVPCPLTNGGAVSQNAHYYLTQDITNLTSAFSVSGTDVVLDLRGHSIHAPSARACYISGKLSIVDTVGCGTVSTNYTGTGGVAYVTGTGELALYSGALIAKDTTTAKKGGAIYAETGAKVTIKGGEIHGSYGIEGGAISAGNKNTITIEGGTIYGSQVTGGGSAIYMYNGTLTMTGGAIVGGTAANGGAIYANGANINLLGGSVTGGSVTGYGGTYYGVGNTNNSCLNLGNCDLSGGTAATAGQDIYLTATGKIKVLSSFAGNSVMAVDSSHITATTPGSTLHATWETCEGPFPGQLALESAGEQLALNGKTGDTKLYFSSIYLVKNNGKKLWFSNHGVAIDAYNNSADIAYMKPDAGTLNLTGGNYTLDIAGQSITVTGKGTLSCMDSANDAYQLSAGRATVADSVQMVLDVTNDINGYRYIAVEESDGVYSFHRLDVTMKEVVLRPSAAGIYYKAVFNCDAVLASKVNAYGVALSLDDMPGANFRRENLYGGNNVYTVSTEAFTPGILITSGSVFNIMKTTNASDVNVEHGQMNIYANAYLQIDGVGTVVGDSVNPGKAATDQDFTGIAYSLLDVLKAIDSDWDTFVEAGKDDDIKAFYDAWVPYGITAWADMFENISK